MSANFKPGLRQFLMILFVPACIVGITYAAGIRINLTPSMPLGLYYFSSSTPRRGDIVAVCLPENIASEGLKRHYLFYGHCHDNGTMHSMAVLKQVIAVPDDEVIVGNTEIMVNGQIYTAPQQATDSNDLPITHFIHKSFYNYTTGYWLYGQNDPVHSWDSRYYGVIPREDIIGVFKPFWTLKKSGDWHGYTESPRPSPCHSPPCKITNPINSQPRGEFVSYFSRS